jgi:hypothetical protein
MRTAVAEGGGGAAGGYAGNASGGGGGHRRWWCSRWLCRQCDAAARGTDGGDGAQ